MQPLRHAEPQREPEVQRRESIQHLARCIRGILAAGPQRDADAIPTGWEHFDAALEQATGRAGLASGAVHEWIGVEGGRGAWSPPLAVLTHLARNALEAHGDRHREKGAVGHVVWVGRPVWPYAPSLAAPFAPREAGTDPTTGDATGGATLGTARLELVRRPVRSMAYSGGAGPEEPRHLLDRSVFIDASRPGPRLWAIDAALRCPSVAAVVADGSGLDLPATRRLQLAAEAGGGLALIARPPAEAGQLSAAATRTLVTRLSPESVRRGVVPANTPGWALRIQRCKNVFGIRDQGEGEAPCSAS